MRVRFTFKEEVGRRKRDEEERGKRKMNMEDVGEDEEGRKKKDWGREKCERIGKWKMRSGRKEF